jgi:hypothetical protein
MHLLNKHIYLGLGVVLLVLATAALNLNTSLLQGRFSLEQFNVEQFKVASSNSLLVDNTVNACAESYKLDLVKYEDRKMYQYENIGFTQYFNATLFPNQRIAKQYICRVTELDKEAYKFIIRYLGFTPARFTEVTIFNPGDEGIAYYSQHNHQIINSRMNRITEEHIINLEQGNTHEYVHAFFGGTNVSRSWFEEGLADYIANTQRFGRQSGAHSGVSSDGIYCKDDHWETGYYDTFGRYIRNSPEVVYSDFSVPVSNDVDFYNPLSKSSYYYSALCMWSYIEENYGSSTLRTIALRWNSNRGSDDQLDLIIDIARQYGRDDIKEIARDRYNYTGVTRPIIVVEE